MTIDFGSMNKTVQSTFSDPIVVVRQNGADTTTRGTFDSRHIEVEGDGQISVSTLVTTMLVDLDDTGAIGTDDRIAHASNLYRVTDQRPDGQGMTILELEKVGA